MIEQDEILSKYAETIKKDEPIRLLKNTDKVESWSNVPPYAVMLLTQMKMLSDEIGINIIEDEVILPYLKFRLSADGYARTQFKEAHSSLLDTMKPILAGVMNNDQRGLERK